MPRAKEKVVLVFGESDSDRSALIEIARSVKPNTKIRFSKRAKPLVLLRSTEKAGTRRTAATEIAALVKAAGVVDEVVAVIAHRDCDEIEPAHMQVASEIEGALTAAGVKVPIAAAPAFEMEAWWFLFPQAIALVRPCWRPLAASTHNVGYIRDAKESLTRCLRPADPAKRRSCPDYAESDGVSIARKAREIGEINQIAFSRSGSLTEFCGKIARLPI